MLSRVPSKDLQHRLRHTTVPTPNPATSRGVLSRMPTPRRLLHKEKYHNLQHRLRQAAMR